MAELRSILHVDDDEDILEIARIALELVDRFDLRQFSSGQSALDALRNGIPDLLLLDVMMPKMTGPEFWEAAVAATGRPIPAIFMTAKAEDELTRALHDRGALAVITKPFDPMVLGAQIRAAWAQSN